MSTWFSRAVAAVRQPRADRIVAVAMLLLFALARAGGFEERDPYWEARAGVENLAGQPLLRPDTWSWSGVGGDWYQNSPLWNDILGLGWLAGGFWGLFAVTLLLIGGYLLLAFFLGLLLGGRPLPALAAVILTVSPAISMISPRGTLVVEVLILGAVAVAVWAAKGPLARGGTALAATAVLIGSAAWSTVGNWMHLSFLMISPAMAVVLIPVWWLAPLPRARRVAVILASGIGWAVGPVASPYGLVQGLQHSSEVARVCEGLILEWVSPFSENSHPVFWLMAVVAILVAVAITWWLVWRLRGGDRSVAMGGLLALSLIGVPAALAGLTAIRFLGVALLTLAPVAAVAATDAVGMLRRWLREHSHPGLLARTQGDYWRPLVAAAVVVLLPWALVVGSNHAVPKELSAVEKLPAGCILFAPGGLSATAVLTRPDVKVWIDGRADFYGRAHLILTYRYFFLETPQLVPEQATCLMMDRKAKESDQLAAALLASPDWRVIAEDDRYVVWVPAE